MCGQGRRRTKRRAALSHPVSKLREMGRISPSISPQASWSLLTNWAFVSLCPVRRNGMRGSVSGQRLRLLLYLGSRHQPQCGLMLYTSAGPHSPFNQGRRTPNAGMASNFPSSLHNRVLNPPTWEDTDLRQSEHLTNSALFNSTSKTKTPHIPFLLWQHVRTKGKSALLMAVQVQYHHLLFSSITKSPASTQQR